MKTKYPLTRTPITLHICLMCYARGGLVRAGKKGVDRL